MATTPRPSTTTTAARPVITPVVANPRPAAQAATDFVILTALEEERDAVLPKLGGYRKLPPAADDVRVYFGADVPARFPDGSGCTYRAVVLTLPNMGRVEAANATNDAIRRWRPRYVLLVGIAGGVAGQGVRLGDVLISDQVVDYELQKVRPTGPEVRWQVHPADARLLNAARNTAADDWLPLVTAARPAAGLPARHVGPVATGDKVVAAADLLKRQTDVWHKLIGVEMEAGGAAKAAFQAASKPGFFMVRGTSDLADENKDDPDVKAWRAYACDVAAAFTVGLLRGGCVPPG